MLNYGSICNITSNSSNNSNAFTKAQNIKELFEFHKNLMSKTRTAKKQAETVKAPYNHEKNIKPSVVDGERQKIETNIILDKIAGGMNIFKHELMLVGEEAVKKAQYINAERKIFALQLKNCKTREDAERLYHAKVRTITYGIIENPPIQSKDMIGRYVRTMRNEWSRHIALMR